MTLQLGIDTRHTCRADMVAILPALEVQIVAAEDDPEQMSF